MLAEVPTTAERALETGTRGRGGDRTLEIDQDAEQLVLDELDALRDEGYQFVVCSEERGEIDYGDHGVRVIIDPIDGSLNAKRGISHYALSIAVGARVSRRRGPAEGYGGRSPTGTGQCLRGCRRGRRRPFPERRRSGDPRTSPR